MANPPKENAKERHERVKRQIAGAYAKGIAIEYANQLAQSLGNTGTSILSANQLAQSLSQTQAPLPLQDGLLESLLKLPEDIQIRMQRLPETIQKAAENQKQNVQIMQELVERFPKSEWLEQAKGLFEVMQMQAKSLEKAKQIADATLFQVFPESQAAEALKQLGEEYNQSSVQLHKVLEVLKQRAEEEERKAAEEAAKKAEHARATRAGVRRRERELAKTPDDLWGFTTQSRALYDFGHLKFELTAGGGAVAEVEGQFKATLKRLPKGRGQNSPVLDVFTRKLFVWLRMKVLAQLNELGKDGLTDTAIANIRRSKAVTVTPEAIAPDFGLTDQRRRNIGPQLKEALMILRGAYWEYVDERQKGKDGEDRFLQVNIADQLSGEKKSGSDVFRFEFSQPFAEYLGRKCRLMYINKKLFQIDAHKNPHSFYIADKLLDHYNQNIGKPNANRIRVCNLLKACPDLPKYEEIMSTTRQVGKRIKDPFERDFDALLLQEYDRGKYGILKSLRFCKDKGESLIAEGADDNPGIEDETEERMTDWGEYTNLIVEFDWANIPDQTKWIKGRKALTKAAKATKTQKAEKTKGRRGRPSKAKAANSPDQPVGKEA